MAVGQTDAYDDILHLSIRRKHVVDSHPLGNIDGERISASVGVLVHILFRGDVAAHVFQIC